MTDAPEKQPSTDTVAVAAVPPAPVLRSTVATDVALVSTFAAFVAVEKRVRYPLVRLGILRKKEGMTDQQFRDHWLNKHAALCLKLPKMRRYSVNFVDRERFPKFGYDGFSELWFDSAADCEAAFASPEGAAVLADLRNYVEGVDPVFIEEHRIVWP